MEQQSYATKQQGIDYVKHLNTEIKEKLPLQLKMMRASINVLAKISIKQATNLTVKLFLTPKRYKLSSEQLEIYEMGKTWTETVLERDLFMFQVGVQPQVLLVHGWGSSSFKLRHIMQALHAQGISFLAFDQPANSLSPGKRTNFYEVRKLIAEILKSNPSIRTVIGHSFGGTAAYQGIQEMDSHNIARLVMLGSPSRIMNFTLPFFKLLHVPVSVQKPFLDRISQIAHLPIDYQISDYPQKQEMEILYIHDNDDFMIPMSEVEENVKQMENTQLIKTEGLGHRGILNNEGIISQIMNFIEFQN